MTSNKLKTPMAALLAKAPQRPTEDASRIQAQAQDTEKLRAMLEWSSPAYSGSPKAVLIGDENAHARRFGGRGENGLG